MSTAQIIEAHPRTPDDVARLPQRPEIVVAAEERGIRDVVHFTTTRGAVGVLAARAVKSRARLPEDEYLEHVYRPNAEIRKDRAWFDYVNLSISRINDWMFDASTRWHADDGNPWVVLSFAPCILGHPGVIFTTTNNIYPRLQACGGFGWLLTVVRGFGSWPVQRTARPHRQRACMDHGPTGGSPVSGANCPAPVCNE